MKLRRTLVAAAATTAIVPATLLTATAAQADGGSSASPSPSASPSASASSPAVGTGATPSASAPPSSSASASATGSGSPSASPTPSTPPCSPGHAANSVLDLSVKGLPARIAAGSGRHTFTLHVSNPTSTSIGEVNAAVSVNNSSDSENAKDWLRTYTVLEYWDADSNKWLSLKDEVGSDGAAQYGDTGLIFGYTTLKAHEYADVKFRMEIDAKAPTGHGYAIGGATYVDTKKNCYHGSNVEYGFVVLAPGEKGGGSAEGHETTAPTAAGPQGGTSNIPVTGSLAETGSSPALPVIAAVGGSAVVVGTGTVITMRRRRSGSTPAA